VNSIGLECGQLQPFVIRKKHLEDFFRTESKKC